MVKILTSVDFQPEKIRSVSIAGYLVDNIMADAELCKALNLLDIDYNLYSAAFSAKPHQYTLTLAAPDKALFDSMTQARGNQTQAERLNLFRRFYCNHYLPTLLVEWSKISKELSRDQGLVEQKDADMGAGVKK